MYGLGFLKAKANRAILRGSLFALFSFFNKGLNFFLLIVIANYLTPDAYGELSLFTTLLTLIGYVICLSSEGYAAVSYFKESESQYQSIISSVFFLSCVIFLLLCGVVYISSIFTDKLFDLTISEVYSALLISFFSIFVHVGLDYFRVKEKIFTYGKFCCSYALLNFILTLLLIANFHTGWYGRIYALTVSSMIYALFALFVFIKEHRFSFHSISSSSLKKIIFWGLPLIPHLASTWIKQGGDRYIIKANYDISEVGIFSFALNLVNILCMLGVAFNSSNSVDIYKLLSNPTDATFARLHGYTKKMLLLYAVISITLIIVCMLLIPLLLPRYTESLTFFVLLVPYGYLQCIYFLYCNYLFFYGENKRLMKITFITSIVHLCLSLTLTSYSLYATAIVYTLTQLLVILFLRLKVIQLLKSKLSNYRVNWVL